MNFQEKPTAAESSDDDNLNRIREFQFAEPMIYDLLGHLGQVPTEYEIKYLSIIPLNGDPFLFIPGLLKIIRLILQKETLNKLMINRKKFQQVTKFK